MMTQQARWSRLLLTACSVVMAGSALANGDRAVLRFADLGGIRDWRAETDKAILIEGRNRQWYRATFFAPCVGLRFTDRVAFVTEPSGDLDKFSSILVQGERCWFRTFAPAEAPDSGIIAVEDPAEPDNK